jgi:hypothetical protein
MSTPINTIIIIALALFDAFCYGYLHEKKGWNLFWQLKYRGRDIFPVYRIVEWSINAYALYWLYDCYGLWSLIGAVIAISLMSKDGIYYLAMRQIQDVLDYEKTDADVYWLKHWYSIGQFLFRKGFNAKWFFVSATAGLVISLLTNII